MHTVPSGAPRDLNNRMDNLDLTNDYARKDYAHDYARNDYEYTSRVASPNGDRYAPDRNGGSAPRNIMRDAIRSQSIGRPSLNEQRPGQLHSSASSVRTNRFGIGNSVDSFNI